jgi:hypothetical protein
MGVGRNLNWEERRVQGMWMLCAIEWDVIKELNAE